MTIPAFSHSPLVLSLKHFEIELKLQKKNTRIIMSVKNSHINTLSFPNTYEILNSQLPSVLNSSCYNDELLPFHQEVTHTEIGHLFEHIFLEYLCMAKISYGATHATFKGNTKWNWKKNPWGTFFITINSGYKDSEYILQSLKKTIFLTNTIINSSHSKFIPLQLSSITT